ncbi:MAG: SpvB/TcaC N-terminal domain-containing protein [Gammaproteobacteria bacterium]
MQGLLEAAISYVQRLTTFNDQRLASPVRLAVHQLLAITLFLPVMTLTTFVSASTFIIDNGDAGTAPTGNWVVSKALNPFGADSLYSNAAGDSYSYAFSVQPGEYMVSAWWTEYSNRVTNAPIDITHAYGTDTVTVNQQLNAGQWNTLGTFTFGSQAVVTVHSVGNGTTSVDAIRLEPVASDGNEAPVLELVGDIFVTAGQMLEFTIHANDPDGSIPTLSAAGVLASATFTDLGDGTASFSWPTTPSDVGSVNITFTASDGELTNNHTITITVVAEQSSTLIIDNGDAGTAPTGNWVVSNALNPFGADSLYSKDAGDSYSYVFNLQPGRYTVSAWWTEYSNRVTNATIDIKHAVGTNTVTVNQQRNGGKWNSLGTFTFGSQGVMTVHSIGNGTTSVDAIRLEPVATDGNAAPVLAAIGNHSVNAGETVEFTLSANDPDGTIPSLSANGIPAAATFADLNDGTASFSWQTTSSDAGSSIDITFTASDGQQSSSETITIEVVALPPMPPDRALITQTDLGNGRINVTGAEGSVEPDSVVTITSSTTGVSITTVADSNGAFTAVISATNGDELSIKSGNAHGDSEGVSVAAVTQAVGTGLVGSIRGSFGVAPSGGATYSIPIEVPPGIAGLAPKLSFNHNSQDQNSLLGVGWRLGGLSSIHRCPATVAQDGFKDGVDFDSNDRYCLDGQRLVVVSGAYGGHGAEYRTEIDTFSRVRSYGNVGGAPAYFTVETKSGETMWYGQTTGTRVAAGNGAALAWLVDKVSDAVNNEFTVDYSNIPYSPGEKFPSLISYAGGNASITFQYEGREDNAVRHVGGSAFRSTRRLIGVSTYTNHKLVKQYQLRYNNRAAGAPSQLANITECDGQRLCKPATTFTWQSTSHQPTFEALRYSAVRAAPDTGQTVSGDINGDGISDLVSLTTVGRSITLMAAPPDLDEA